MDIFKVFDVYNIATFYLLISLIMSTFANRINKSILMFIVSFTDIFLIYLLNLLSLKQAGGKDQLLIATDTLFVSSLISLNVIGALVSLKKVKSLKSFSIFTHFSTNILISLLVISDKFEYFSFCFTLLSIIVIFSNKDGSLDKAKNEELFSKYNLTFLCIFLLPMSMIFYVYSTNSLKFDDINIFSQEFFILFITFFFVVFIVAWNFIPSNQLWDLLRFSNGSRPTLGFQGVILCAFLYKITTLFRAFYIESNALVQNKISVVLCILVIFSVLFHLIMVEKKFNIDDCLFRMSIVSMYVFLPSITIYPYKNFNMNMAIIILNTIISYLVLRGFANQKSIKGNSQSSYFVIRIGVIIFFLLNLLGLPFGPGFLIKKEIIYQSINYISIYYTAFIILLLGISFSIFKKCLFFYLNEEARES